MQTYMINIPVLNNTRNNNDNPATTTTPKDSECAHASAEAVSQAGQRVESSLPGASMPGLRHHCTSPRGEVKPL